MAAELEIEPGYSAVVGELGTVASGGIAKRHFAEMLSAEDVHLIEMITRALARVASAVSVAHRLNNMPNAIEAAIDGAEMVMWGELVRGGGVERLAAMLPGFVFLAVLPLIGREEALRVCERTAKLLDRAAAGGNCA